MGLHVYYRRRYCGSARFSSFSAWGVEVKNASLLLVLKLAPLALTSTDWVLAGHHWECRHLSW